MQWLLTRDQTVSFRAGYCKRSGAGLIRSGCETSTGSWCVDSPWKWVWPARLRRLAVSSPGCRLRSRLARFAAVSRQGAPRSKSTRLPDPAASPHQFLHDRSEYKVLKFISDTTTTPCGVQSRHAPTL